MTTMQELRGEYDRALPDIQRFSAELLAQLQSLFTASSLTLGVPMEHRVKSWQSLEEKLQRKRLELPSIFSLDDLVGIRTIFLFQRDLALARNLVRNTFIVESEEDTASRLDEAEFGYQSWHYIVRMPPSWSTVPTLAGFEKRKAELQIRTIAQHIWAAASHKLQYKQEASVPQALRRSIHRVSALLETVDLEFERVLSERDAYRAAVNRASPERALDVDSLAGLLAETWPEVNMSPEEPYAALLADAVRAGIKTIGQLRDVLHTQRDRVLAADRRKVEDLHGTPDSPFGRRLTSGTFYTHVGLTRLALSYHLGERVDPLPRRPG